MGYEPDFFLNTYDLEKCEKLRGDIEQCSWPFFKHPRYLCLKQQKLEENLVIGKKIGSVKKKSFGNFPLKTYLGDNFPEKLMICMN